ncbi:hypothetical protein ACFQY9_01325 [Microvirga aerilata]|uniref:hypothetical protein n=1 Tax=Microvirga aerilata TaxID=670292 RepID=UPI00363591DD
MRKILGVLAVAGLTVLGAGTASAQGVGVQIGPGGVRVVQERHHAPGIASASSSAAWCVQPGPAPCAAR